MRVVLGSGEPEMKEGALVIHTTAKLEKGQANRDVVQQVAKFFGVQSGNVRIVKGFKSRRKTLEIQEKSTEYE